MASLLPLDGEWSGSSVRRTEDLIIGSISITGTKPLLYCTWAWGVFKSTMSKTYNSKPCRVPTNGPHSDCTRISKRQKKNKRKPALDFPEPIPEIYKDGDEEDDRSLVSMRAEPTTPEACCKDVPRGQKTNFEGCQALIKNGETALGADMGFYFNFTVDPETGKPGGCDGLTFNKLDKTGTVNCGMNHYAPEGEPLYQIVEDFADHQDNWIRDFLVAFDKMSKNGNTDLVDGPTKWFGTTCKPVGKNEKKAIWTCKRNWRGCKPNKDQKDQGPEIWSC